MKSYCKTTQMKFAYYKIKFQHHDQVCKTCGHSLLTEFHACYKHAFCQTQHLATQNIVKLC